MRLDFRGCFARHRFANSECPLRAIDGAGRVILDLDASQFHRATIANHVRVADRLAEICTWHARLKIELNGGSWLGLVNALWQLLASQPVSPIERRTRRAVEP